MKLNDENLQELCQLACDAACAAGELIARYSNRAVVVNTKVGGDHLASRIVTEVDCKSESLIVAKLQGSIARYDLALLTEEQEDDRQRLTKDYFWCIDPLDGTLAFTESQAGYAVSIALVSREGVPVIGVIYDPVTAMLYSAVRGRGAFRGGESWCLPAQQNESMLTMPCDRSLVEHRDYQSTIELTKAWAISQGLLGLETIHSAGAVMNACWVLEKTPGVYYKRPKKAKGGGSLWDFAATACLFTELGGIVSDFYGQPLALNSSDSTFMNQRGVIFASNACLADFIQSNLLQIQK